MTTRFLSFLSILAAVLILFAGCDKQQAAAENPSPEEEGLAEDPQPEVKSIAVYEIPQAGSRDLFTGKMAALQEQAGIFGFRLLRQLYAGADVNLSPLSLQLALSMLMNGAEGDTFSEIRSALGLSGASLQDINAMSASLLRHLSASVDGKGAQVKCSDLIVVNDRIGIRDAFCKSAADNYYAPVASLDFSDPKRVLSLVNDWSGRNTEGLIPELMTDLPESVMLMILNALYVKARWEEIPFDSRQTEEKEFTASSGKKGKVQMMHRSALPALYAERPAFSVARLSLCGHMGLYIFLPKEGKTPADVLDILAKGGFPAEQKAMEFVDELDLHLPKFTISNDFDLKRALDELGIKQAFSPWANLSALSETALSVGQVLQKNRFAVDEYGVEGASVTAVTGDAAANIPDEIRRAVMNVDHAFVYVLADGRTGAVLFTGVCEGNF